MNEQDVFEGLTKLALEDHMNVPADDIKDISFCVFVSATRTDGEPLGGAFMVDPNVGDIEVGELIETSSIPSLTSYILTRHGQHILNRCVNEAIAVQGADTTADFEGAKH